jgi:MoxR-like ATPase
MLDGRDYVIPDDVRAEALAVLAHRVRPDSAEQTGKDVVRAALEIVAVE